MKAQLSLVLGLSLFSGQAALAATTADIIFVVDESGSMAGEHKWISNMVSTLNTGLVNAGVTGNRYGLVGYGANSGHGTAGHDHTVGSGLFGNASQLAAASLGLVATGGTEDGYEAIKFGFDNYKFRSNAAVNFILVTDEDRDVLGGTNLTVTAMKGQFKRNNALLNTVVDAKLKDGSGKTAVGVNSHGNAYTSDGIGGLNSSAGGVAVSGFGRTIADYVDLAFASKGATWDLNQLRSGGLAADAFTTAFVKTKVDEIFNQTPTTAPVPVPATLWLVGTGLMGLFGIKKNKTKASA